MVLTYFFLFFLYPYLFEGSRVGFLVWIGRQDGDIIPNPFNNSIYLSTLHISFSSSFTSTFFQFFFSTYFLSGINPSSSSYSFRVHFCNYKWVVSVRSHNNWRREWVSTKTLGFEGGWSLRPHICWRGNKAFFIVVETSL